MDSVYHSTDAGDESPLVYQLVIVVYKTVTDRNNCRLNSGLILSAACIVLTSALRGLSPDCSQSNLLKYSNALYEIASDFVHIPFEQETKDNC